MLRSSLVWIARHAKQHNINDEQHCGFYNTSVDLIHSMFFLICRGQQADGLMDNMYF